MTPLHQLLYVSSSNPDGAKIDVPRLIEQSRHNNAIDGVTGLLWSDGKRFLQVLEGPEDGVATTFARIRGDDRHQAIVILSQGPIAERHFGVWSMAQRGPGDSADEFDRKVRRALETAPDDVRDTFLTLIAESDGQAGGRPA